MTSYTIIIGVRGTINTVSITVKASGFYQAAELAKTFLNMLDAAKGRLEAMKPEIEVFHFELAGIMPSSLVKPYEPIKTNEHPAT